MGPHLQVPKQLFIGQGACCNLPFQLCNTLTRFALQHQDKPQHTDMFLNNRKERCALIVVGLMTHLLCFGRCTQQPGIVDLQPAVLLQEDLQLVCDSLQGPSILQSTGRSRRNRLQQLPQRCRVLVLLPHLFL